MKRKFGETRHAMKMIYGCAALVLVAVALASSAYAVVFVLGCVLMMGAMMWMMMGSGGMGRRPKVGAVEPSGTGKDKP